MKKKRFETKGGAKRAVNFDRLYHMNHEIVMDGNQWAVVFYCPSWETVRLVRSKGYEGVYRKQAFPPSTNPLDKLTAPD
ncbi:MAG: hypothetical protein V6Z86_05450 [Hyphomicrobiales bacterium]